MTEIARRILVHGRVQGVGYRYWALGLARRWAVRGWVRNRQDGSVEILCIGAPAAVDGFIDHCQLGPPTARVTEVVTLPALDDGSVGFESRATV